MAIFKRGCCTISILHNSSRQSKKTSFKLSQTSINDILSREFEFEVQVFSSSVQSISGLISICGQSVSGSILVNIHFFCTSPTEVPSSQQVLSPSTIYAFIHLSRNSFHIYIFGVVTQEVPRSQQGLSPCRQFMVSLTKI